MVTVRANKYDGSAHRSWSAEILRYEGALLVLNAVFAEEVRHDLLGTIERGTLSLEYYWLDRWYNIFRFQQPTGELRNYYCNVNIPPQFDGEVLSYIDLDIDILVNADFSYQILDQDEFEQNAAAYGYSDDVLEQARRAVAELKSLIETRSFPFCEPGALVP
jgi:protein associated with RNAse G/E